MATASSDRVTVIVYSNLAEVRAQVRTAVGRRPAPDVPRIDWIECATSAQVVEQIDLGDVDLAILDGEAQPTGGMGLARQLSECTHGRQESQERQDQEQRQTDA